MRPLGLVFLLWAALGGLASDTARAADPARPNPDQDDLTIPLVFPEHAVEEPDAYLCTAVPLPDRPLKLVGVTPTSDEEIVHHMLLFGAGRSRGLGRGCTHLPPPPAAAPARRPPAPQKPAAAGRGSPGARFRAPQPVSLLPRS